jgi:hypothetical protein
MPFSNLLRQLGIDRADLLEDALDPVAVDAIEDFRGDADAAKRDPTMLGFASQQILDRLVQFANRRRRDRVERSEARNDLFDQLVRQVLDQRIGLLRLHVGEDHRDDLRVLVFDHLGQHARVLQLHRLDAGKVVALVQPARETLGLFGAQRPLEHAVHVGFGADADRGFPQHRVDEFLEYPGNLQLRDIGNPRHRHRQQIDLQLRHVLHHLGGGLFADREHHHRRFLDVGELSRRAKQRCFCHRRSIL